MKHDPQKVHRIDQGTKKKATEEKATRKKASLDNFPATYDVQRS